MEPCNTYNDSCATRAGPSIRMDCGKHNGPSIEEDEGVLGADSGCAIGREPDGYDSSFTHRRQSDCEVVAKFIDRRLHCSILSNA